MDTNGSLNGTAPSGATDAVLKPSDPVPEGAIPVQGLDFNEYADRNITVAELVDNMSDMGFQASSIGKAVEIINGMVCRWLAKVVASKADRILTSGLGAMLNLESGQRYFSVTRPILSHQDCGRLCAGSCSIDMFLLLLQQQAA